MNRTYGFRLATAEESPAVALTIATASASLPVSQWLVPEAGHRPAVLYADAAVTVEHAMTHGQVWTVPDHAAVAVLLDATPATTEDLSGRFAEAWGTYADRFRTLRAAIDVHRPTTTHRYLAFLAAGPTGHDAGLDAALLRRLTWHLDHDSLPAVAVAAIDTARSLLQNCGFRTRGQRLDLPDPVQAWPMWRSSRLPRPASACPE